MIDEKNLLNLFLDLVRIPSPSGQEGAVADAIAAQLRGMGLSVERDEAGNLLSYLDGEGEPLLLTAHMDTVTPCENVRPVVRDGVVYSDGTTILGSDDKAGVAVILEVLRALRDGRGVHAEALLRIVGAQHEDDQVQRIVAHQAGRQVLHAAFVAALGGVVKDEGAAVQALLDDPVPVAEQRL